MSKSTSKNNIELIEVDGVWMSKKDIPEAARIKHQQQYAGKLRNTNASAQHTQASLQDAQIRDALHEFIDGFQQGAKILAAVLKFTR